MRCWRCLDSRWLWPKIRVTAGGGKVPDINIQRGLIDGPGMPVELLCVVLQGELGFPIVDGTGVVGSYDLRMVRLPDERQPNSTAAGDERAEAPSFAAPQEQLRLKLERKKAAVAGDGDRSGQEAVKRVSLITDGSCIGNPGPGGWACVMWFGAVKKELFGYDSLTTNNRMELMAPIQGLLALKEPCEVEITTDSEYVRQGITIWVKSWRRRHWWRKNRAVRNADLWIELDELDRAHRTTWLWTKGHAAHEDNNRCDVLAQSAARTQSSSFPDGAAHGLLRLNLGRDYVPPKPQGSLFDDFGGEDEDGDPG